jgi:uncharacterized membrane protein
VVANAGELEFERVIFFSDAVFAIAITLLVINIRVPAPVGRAPTLAQFARGLSGETGRILSWALSFYVVGRYWTNHHAMFRHVAGFDRRLVGLNLVLLACVAFMPYATNVMGEWGYSSPGAASYAACLATVGLAQSAIWFHAARGGLTAPRVPQRLANRYLVVLLQPPVVFLASIPVAFVSPLAAECLWGLNVVTWRLMRRRVEAAPDQTQAAGA